MCVYFSSTRMHNNARCGKGGRQRSFSDKGLETLKETSSFQAANDCYNVHRQTMVLCVYSHVRILYAWRFVCKRAYDLHTDTERPNWDFGANKKIFGPNRQTDTFSKARRIIIVTQLAFIPKQIMTLLRCKTKNLATNFFNNFTLNLIELFQRCFLFCLNKAQKKTSLSSHTWNDQSKHLKLFVLLLLFLPLFFFQSLKMYFSPPTCTPRGVKYGFTLTCDDLRSPALRAFWSGDG